MSAKLDDLYERIQGTVNDVLKLSGDVADMRRHLDRVRMPNGHLIERCLCCGVKTARIAQLVGDIHLYICPDCNTKLDRRCRKFPEFREYRLSSALLQNAVTNLMSDQLIEQRMDRFHAAELAYRNRVASILTEMEAPR